MVKQSDSLICKLLMMKDWIIQYTDNCSTDVKHLLPRLGFAKIFENLNDIN